jgi:MFS family permease
MIGAAAGSYLQDIFGRRSTLGLGSLLSIGAIATCYLSDLAASPNSAFFGGKMFEGIAVGMIICSTQTYISEVVPTRLRAPAFALFPAVQMFGQLVSSLIVLGLLGLPGRASYRIAIALQWPFSSVPLILALVMPESPSWLIQNDKDSAALQSFQKLYGFAGSVENSDIFMEMSRTVAEERQASRSNTTTYLECLRGVDLRRTLISVFAVMLPELFGMHLLGNASYFVQQIGLTATTGMVITILGVVLGLVANGISFWTLSRF